MKFCKCCEKTLPKEKFAKNSKNGDGLYTYCRACSADKRKAYLPKYNEWRDRNKQRIKERRHEYYLNNRENWPRRTPEANRSHVRKWEKDNPCKVRAKMRRQHERLTGTCVKRLLVKGTSLKHGDIPDGLVEAKRLEIQIKRQIKDML